MRITSISIKNLRSFSDVVVPFNNYTCLVGPNGSGKSTILHALNVFFRESSNSSTDVIHLDKEDFHGKNTDLPIEITVTFEGLSIEAQADFADYYRQGKLIISAAATFNAKEGKAQVRQYGQRLGLLDFASFFQAVGDGKKVSELKELYTSLRKKFDQLPPPGTKDAMVAALHQYEANNPKMHSLIPSEDQFYGISKGANRLAKYVQWVYVPAVKDASTEQIEARNTALGKLLARTVRAKTNFEEDVLKLRATMQEQYQGLLDQNQSALKELSSSLKTRLSEWAHPDASIKLEWQQDPEKSVRVEEPLARIIAGEGNFEGDLARFGHGLQRSYLLALLHELASSDDANAPRLILGCEEPELYQHPPQARHLASVLTKLSEANSQIIASTHSSLFVSGEGFEDVRMVRKEPEKKCSNIHYMTYENVSQAVAAANGEKPWKPEGALAKIHQALQPSLSEMFFASRLILVEGLEDIAYLTTYLHLLGLWDDYRRTGCHLIACNGKSEILQSLVIAKGLGIPTKIIFDSDADKEDKN
ncbi:MAG TPA: AAA family ATPase, partial [Hyphomicrobium sp.]|nr:AAA family ATPase [Hyphomicrobium sp.]